MSNLLLKSSLIGVLLLLNLYWMESLKSMKNSNIPSEQERQSPAATAGEGNLTLVKFPDGFTRTSTKIGTFLVTNLKYEIRRRPESSADEIIFGMRDEVDEHGRWPYSDNFYAVTLDGRFETRPVDEQEWNDAQVVPAARENDTPNPIHYAPVVKGKVQFQGKWYPVSGKAERENILFPSLDGRWLAVFSDTSKERKGASLLGGRGRTKGKMFVDVYDTTTGEKVLAGRAPHRGGSSPWDLFTNALWLENRYLIVPLDSTWNTLPGQRCFFGILPH